MYIKGNRFIHFGTKWIAIMSVLLSAHMLHAQTKVFVAARDTEIKGIEGALSANNASFIPIIYQYSLDPDNKVELREDLLLAELRRYFPGKNDAGICILDWEGKTLDYLSDSPDGSEQYKLALGLFLKALELLKKERPNVKFGYFGINRVNIYTQDAAWAKKNDRMLPIYKASDILFPQFYYYYPDSLIGKPNANKTWVTNNVHIMLKYGAQLQKPVYCFTWHRCHDDLKSVPDSEYYKHVDYLLKASYRKRKVDAIILWTGDEQWINVNEKMVMDEKGSLGSSAYREQNLGKYIKIIHEAVKMN